MTTALARRIITSQQTLLRPGGTAPTPPPTTLLQRHAVDCSNYTDWLGVRTVTQWRDEHDIGLVIVQSLDTERFPQSRTIAQLIACSAAGMTVDIYVYPFFANGPTDCSKRLSEAKKAGVPIRRVFLDVEDVDPSQRALGVADRIRLVRTWLDQCDAFPARVKPAGVYTGKWYWSDPRYMDNTIAFKDRPLWAAQYDGIEDTNVFTPFGGWAACAIKQFKGTTSLAGISGVDLNVLANAERALA